MRISDWSSDVCSSDLQRRKCGVLDEFLARREHEGKSRGGADIEPGMVGLAAKALRDAGKLAGEHHAMEVGRRVLVIFAALEHAEIGRASCRERVCQYV